MNRKSSLFASVLLLAIASSAPAILIAPPNVPLRAFGDQHDWIVLEPMGYPLGDTRDFIIVPAGFVTDLASIPPELWSFGLTPTGKYGRAAIVHDYLYWTQRCTPEEANRLLVIAMKESDVGVVDENVIYAGVSVGGNSAWKSNAQEKKDGKPRILPPDWRNPPAANISWLEYRQKAFKAGVRDEPVYDDGSYCHYGDSFDVPKRNK